MCDCKKRTDDWARRKDLSIAIAALLAALWAGMEVYLNFFVKREIDLAQIDLAKARRVPSLDFAFDYEGVEYAGHKAVIIRVRIHNPGSNAVVLNLGTLKGVDADTVEDFSELVLKRVGKEIVEAKYDYMRIDGRTSDWTRVLVDAGSTKSIPFLVDSPSNGLYQVEFRAKLSPTATKLLLETTEGTFDPNYPIWWSASDYVDFFARCWPNDV